MLCSICSSIDCDLLFPEPGAISRVKHHPDYSDLVAAAQTNPPCEFCAAVVSTRLKGSYLKDGLLTGVSPVHGGQILLRALMKGRTRRKQDYGYHGATQLWVSCGAEVLARFELFVERGENSMASFSRSIMLC